MIGSRHAGRLVAVGLAVFSIGYLVVAFQIPEFAVGVSVQPGTFPKALGALMLVLSVLMFWQRPAASTEGGRPRSPDHESPSPRRDLAVLLVSMVAYVALLKPLGFALVTALYLAAMAYYLGYRRHLVNAAVAVGIAGALQVGLGYGFGINLPAGPLPL
jgi:putative tricarboxylic transport membrane protein